MRTHRDQKFSERLDTAAKARATQLEKVRAQAEASKAGLAERLAARAKINAEREKRAAQRKAEKIAREKQEAK